MVYIRDYPFDIWDSFIGPICEWAVRNILPEPGLLTPNKITVIGSFTLFIICVPYIYFLHFYQNEIGQYLCLNLFYGLSVLVCLITDGIDGIYARYYNKCSIEGEFLDHALDRVTFPLIEIISLSITGVNPQILVILSAVFWFMNFIKLWRQYYFGEIAIDSSGTWIRILAGIVPILLSVLYSLSYFKCIHVITNYGWIIFVFINMRQLIFLCVNDELSLASLFSQKDVILAVLCSLLYMGITLFFTNDLFIVLLCQSCFGAMCHQFLLTKVLKHKVSNKMVSKQTLIDNDEAIMMIFSFMLCYFTTDNIGAFNFWLILLAVWTCFYRYYFVQFSAYTSTSFEANEKGTKRNEVFIILFISFSIIGFVDSSIYTFVY